MNRLTERLPNGVVRAPVTDENRGDSCMMRLAAYEDTGLTPEDLKKAFDETAVLKLSAQCLQTSPDRLRELAAADKDGRVVVLPCKVGDKVYAPIKDRGIISTYIVTDICINKYSTWGKWELIDGIYSNLSGFNVSALGKTVLLTRAEAEAALKGDSK